VASPEVAQRAGAKVSPRRAEWRSIARIFFRRKLAVVGLVIILLVVLMAIFAPLLAPYDPYELEYLESGRMNKLAPPSSEHLLGTDSIGRDTLSRVIYGSRVSLLVGVGAVGLSTVVGVLLGLIAGYFGGWIFNIIMRLLDILQALPMLIFAIVLAVVLGGGVRNVILALGIQGIAAHGRLMCGQVLTVKENDYVLAMRAMGGGNTRTMLGHIFPNAFPPILVSITTGMGAVILAEAALSFLGVGISTTTAAWGSMIADGQRYLLTNPILSFAPMIPLALTVFGFNMMGDGLRDALDPRLRGLI
jgi:ABC-type dipeptide/oligopeptide/nickel transport system permease subunit